MGISDRDYIKGEHPPYCTCVYCTNLRLSELEKESEKNKRLINQIRIRRIISNVLLILFAFICLGFMACTVYLLYQQLVSLAEGIIIILLSTLIFSWIVYILSDLTPS